MMADVQTVTPLRHLVASYNNPIHHPRPASSSLKLYSSTSSTPAMSITGSAGRIARKRASYPGPALPSSTGLTNVGPTPSSLSPSSTSSTTELFNLGTIDFDSIARSLNYLPDAQSISKHHRKTASNSTSASPPASISGLASTALKSSKASSSTTTASAVAGSSSAQTPLFRIPVVPRPTPRLPLFHPHNTTPLPDISRKPTPIAPNAAGPSPAPARRSSARARKPAAKAMALSLGLASDGSALDQQNAEVTTAIGKEATPAEKAEKKAARAAAGKSHKAKRSLVDQDAAAAGEGVDEAAKATIRRAPKRKVAVITDSLGADDGVHSPSPSPVKRPRRGAAAAEAATEPSAPSPLSNEIVQEPDVPAELSSVKRRKTDVGVENDQGSSTLSPPPSPVRPIKARAPKAPRATAGPKGRKAAAAKGPRSISSPPSGDEAANVQSGKPEESSTSVIQPEGSVEADAVAEDEAQEPEVRKPPYNIFEEPLDLKPRPRPVYKAHLKRGSSGSAMGEDKPAPRPRKTRKNTRDDVKKDSLPPNAVTEQTMASGLANAPEQPALRSVEISRTDAMGVDVPPQVRMHAAIVAVAR